jgi:phosphatidyl-myo-inositol dimannoside synthase
MLQYNQLSEFSRTGHPVSLRSPECSGFKKRRVTAGRLSHAVQNMKIVMLVGDAYGGHGGIALYNRDATEALCTHFDNVEIAMYPRQVTAPPHPRPGNVNFVEAASKGVAAYFWAVCKGTLTERSPDLIFCGHIGLTPLAWALSRWHRCPVILNLHGIEAWESRGAVPSWFVRRMSGYLSVSEVTKNRFLAWAAVPPETVQVVPNGVRSALFKNKVPSDRARAKYGIRGGPVLLTVGRLVSEFRAKGFDPVIDVLAQLREQWPDVTYVIAGSGPDSARLAEKVEKLGLSNNVSFLGAFIDEEKPDIYALADVYVMPSRGEGFGYVILEAMASGIPVIASTADGTREATLNGKLGRLVDPDNPAQLVDAVVATLREKSANDPSDLKVFEYDQFAERVVAAFRRVLDRRSYTADKHRS